MVKKGGLGEVDLYVVWLMGKVSQGQGFGVIVRVGDGLEMQLMPALASGAALSVMVKRSGRKLTMGWMTVLPIPDTMGTLDSGSMLAVCLGTVSTVVTVMPV
jgi:hypothetical protein